MLEKLIVITVGSLGAVLWEYYLKDKVEALLKKDDNIIENPSSFGEQP